MAEPLRTRNPSAPIGDPAAWAQKGAAGALVAARRQAEQVAPECFDEEEKEEEEELRREGCTAGKLLVGGGPVGGGEPGTAGKRKQLGVA